MSAGVHFRRFRGSRNMSALWVLSKIAASIIARPVLPYRGPFTVIAANSGMTVTFAFTEFDMKH
jgi:hypothetical protein